MKRDVAGAGRTGNQNHGEAGCQNQTPRLLSGSPLLNLRSKRTSDLHRLLDTIRGLVAAGESVSESRAYDLSSSIRYRKGDCLKALRILHRAYPESTQLILKGGLWVLEPIYPEMSA
jgi:hypothetical protein